MRLLKENNVGFYLEIRINYNSYKRKAIGKLYTRILDNNGVCSYYYQDINKKSIRKSTFLNCYYL